MSFRVAPSCRAVLDQANQLWPNRNKASDGTVGDLSHSARSSDHNPDAAGWVHAVDLTHSPEHGCDAHAWARAVAKRRDPRVRYLISNGQICSWESVAGWPPWAWRPYSGSNKHTAHAHLSIHHTVAARNDTSPWFTAGVTPQEVSRMYENHRFVSAGEPDSAGQVPFYSWDPNASAIFAWNGAPGPVLNASGQNKARAAGGIRSVFAIPGRGWVAVIGDPGENRTWGCWASWGIGPDDKA